VIVTDSHFIHRRDCVAGMQGDELRCALGDDSQIIAEVRFEGPDRNADTRPAD